MKRTLVAFACVTLTACGGWTTTNAQRALEIGSEAVQRTDESLAPTVTAAVDRCDEENETREDFLECIDPYQPIRYGVSLGRRTLRVGQAVVDAWRTGENDGESAWLPIAACIGHALGEIAGAIRDLELELPEIAADILMWVDTFGSLIAGVCPAELLEQSDE